MAASGMGGRKPTTGRPVSRSSMGASSLYLSLIHIWVIAAAAQADAPLLQGRTQRFRRTEQQVVGAALDHLQPQCPQPGRQSGALVGNQGADGIGIGGFPQSGSARSLRQAGYPPRLALSLIHI